MATYVYPTPSDNLPAFVDLVGGFWPTIYGGADFIYNYLRGCVAAQAQIQQDLDELGAVVGRHTCPIFHTALWYSITLLKSQAQPAAAPSAAVAYPVPTELAQINYIADNLVNPTVAFVDGVEVSLNATSSLLTFLSDPFTDSRFTPTPVKDQQGNITDYTLTLWCSYAQLDWKYLYQQFGYVIGAELPSGQTYKDLINAVFTAYTGATAYSQVADLLSAITNAPNCQVDGEVVQVIQTDTNYLLIITDQNIYRFNKAATAIVTVGQVMKLHDQFVDTVYIFEPTNGASPNLTSFTLPASFIDPSIGFPLTFSNSSQALTVTQNVSGYTKLSWPLTGNAGAITAFFTLLHSKGVANGATLANYMDIRPQPQATQPGPASLPSTINPMQFLFKNVLRANCLVIQLKSAGFGPNALGVGQLSYLRQMLPPHMTAVVDVI